MTAIERHRFEPDPTRPIVCAVCGFTRGSVTHSVLGSNMGYEYLHLRQQRRRSRKAAKR